MLNNKTILITGGTGSFGKNFTEYVLNNYNLKKVIIFSRDEFKQFKMAEKFPDGKYPIRYFLGDIRDKARLYRAFEGVDYVVHAAALKQVPALEYNPFEAVKTNILGAQNIVEAALDRGVKKVIALSTDKAVNPVNLYGATKMTMEKIIIAANSYVGFKDIHFSCVRYGNVVGSRGSVIPFFMKFSQKGVKKLPVTDERMTRFWITLDESVKLVINALKNAKGGEVFVPKIPSMKITDLVKVFQPDGEYEIVGIRPGEKIHETLIHEDEGKNAYDLGQYYVIVNENKLITNNDNNYQKHVPPNFIYRSNTNEKWLTVEELKKMVKQLDIEL
ncbi:UDP-N-acetylglucosamine 4,6-dehydratase (inverting) [bacterium]|nr:UDP-N-acetylglucosamine 4,6-dehydratase (inverting) [bacterium]